MMESNSKKNRALAIGTVIYAIGSFGTKFISFIVVPLYTFYIAPEDLGDYDLLMTTVQLLSPILTMKISEATYRWIIDNKDNEIPCISATYLLLVRNSVVFVAIMLILNQVIPIVYCYYFIGLLVLDRIMECLQKLLRGLKNQKLFVASGLFYTVVMVGLNVVKICVYKQGVDALFQSIIIAQAATILLMVVCEKRLRKVKIHTGYAKLQKEMLRYSVPLVPSALCWWFMGASDRYVIRLMLGRAANGIFMVAHKFPSILQTIFVMFNNAWTDLALAECKKSEESSEYVSSVFEKLYKVSFGVVFVLVPATKVVTQLILSDQYKSASVYIGFLYLGAVFQGFSTFYSIGYLQGGKTRGVAKSSICGAITNLVVDVGLMKVIGLYAAAISTFAGFFVMWLIRMYDIKDDYPVSINRRKFMCYFLISIGIAASSIWSSLIIDIVLTILMSVFFCIDNREYLKLLILKLLNRRRKNGVTG